MFETRRKPILRPPEKGCQYRITVDAEQCDGCMLCIEFCPLDVLEVGQDTNRRMLHYVVSVRPEQCVGCAQCERICPTASIFVTEIESVREDK